MSYGHVLYPVIFDTPKPTFLFEALILTCILHGVTKIIVGFVIFGAVYPRV